MKSALKPLAKVSKPFAIERDLGYCQAKYIVEGSDTFDNDAITLLFVLSEIAKAAKQKKRVNLTHECIGFAFEHGSFCNLNKLNHDLFMATMNKLLTLKVDMKVFFPPIDLDSNEPCGWHTTSFHIIKREEYGDDSLLVISMSRCFYETTRRFKMSNISRMEKFLTVMDRSTKDYAADIRRNTMSIVLDLLPFIRPDRRSNGVSALL